MALNAKQKSYLRALAHHRQVIVTVGTGGLTEPVLREIDQALGRHELLKIRLPSIHRDQRADMLEEICEALEADLVQNIGRVGVFYRRGEKPKITIPV
jgi:RNA-binding protein